MKTQNKILIVDDDPVNLEFFQLMLSKLGFTVEQANDGLEALGILKKFHPDIILLDNIMPKMSGWELTKSLKGDSKYRDIPIIMFSALDDVKDKLAGFELGIDDYITKPFNFSEVLARIKTVLRNRELVNRVTSYETRLSQCEEMGRATRRSLAGFAKGIDEVSSSITLLQNEKKAPNAKALAELAGIMQEKAKNLRRQFAELDTRVAKTLLEWEELKKNEVGISTEETPIRKFLKQE